MIEDLEVKMTTATLQWPDYLVFSVTVLITVGIGIYYGIRDRKAKDTETYLLAGRNMPLVPVVLSLFVGWMTAVSFIGDPVEVYLHGSVYWWFGVGYSLSLPIVAHVFAPVYYNLKITSVYEFLKIRYNVYMRTLGSIGYGFWALPFMGIGLYSPSVALGQMTGLQPWIAILILGAVCILYTSFGGLKAVVWSDSVQAFIMVGGLVAIIVEGTRSVGGIEAVFDIAREGERINFLKWGGDPLTRASGWIYLIGGFFQTYDSWTAGQGLIQRSQTLPSVTKVKIALYLCIPCYLIFTTLFWLVGIVMYAYFSKCDPLSDQTIQKTDQLVPLLAIQTLSKYPAVSGLFLACLCAAALSSISSGQNSLAAVTLKDTVEPLYEKRNGKKLSDEAAVKIARILSVVFGVINTGLAIIVYFLEGTAVFSLTIKLTGTIGGPLAGVFSLGILTNFVDTPSVMMAYFSSLGLSMWLALGSLFGPPSQRPSQNLPLSTEGCSASNYTHYETTPWTGEWDTTAPPQTIYFQVSDLYYLAPQLYAPLAWGLCMLLGLIFGTISVIIRRAMGQEIKTYSFTKSGDNSDITEKKAHPDAVGHTNIAYDTFNTDDRSFDSIKLDEAGWR